MIKPQFEETLKLEGNSRGFTYKGYACAIKRVRPETSGHLCGYIHIPSGHKLHGMDYDDIEKLYDYELPAHGGLTFSGYIDYEYWIGFDCSHLGDVIPCEDEIFSSLSIERFESGTYKDMDYVTENIKGIIDFIENKNNLQGGDLLIDY